MGSKGAGIRAVSFDDGPLGPVGLSQIYSFKEVLGRLAYDLELDEDTLQPSDHFDLFAGTGLGGVYVILFTRLRMKITEVIDFHYVLQENLFSSEAWLNTDFDACTLQLNTILNQALSTFPLEDNLDTPDSPKGMICILNPVYPKTPRFLRTYRVRQGFGPRCTIRQAFHAALADGVHLPPVLIQHDRISTKFVAAGSEFPNPTALLTKELRLCFPKAEHVSCILNLGTGTDRDNTAQTVATQCRDLGPFFTRLSVEQLSPDVGDDASQAILAAMENYLLADDISDMVDGVVLAVKERPHIISPARLTSLAGEDGKSQVQAKIEHLTATVSLSRLTEILRPSTSISSFGQQHAPCLPNTRRDVIARLRNLLTNTAGSNVCVVRGHPGTGKSSVATSLAQEFASAGILGAQFFCRRDQSAVHSARNLWRLVALGLAQTQAVFARALSSIFTEAAPDVAALPVSDLFDSIIAKPFASLISVTGPIVVIIDALDEFGGLASPNPAREELVTSLKLWESLPSQFKLFVTTREQLDVTSLLCFESATTLTLEVNRDLVSQTSLDIRHYFEHHFLRIASRYQSLPTPWPPAADLDLLTARAAGLFIWASTIIKVVELCPSTLCDDLLPRIRTGTLTNSGDLAALYCTFLTATFPQRQHHPIFTSVVGAIITAHTPLTRLALCRLLSLNDLAVEEVCQALQPVLSSKDVLAFHHQSFVDFVLSKDCPDPFYCAVEQQHTAMLSACLQVINGPQVHFNMAKMESSYLTHDDIPGLRERVSEHIRYASRGITWHANPSLSHLEDAEFEAFVGRLNQFLKCKLLFWLELVCLEDVFSVVSRELRQLVGKYKNKLKVTLPLLQDTLSFMTTLVGPIQRSYPHIYVSSLPFAPLKSLVVQNFRNNLRGCFTAIGVPDTWVHGRVMNTGRADAITFSPDGYLIVADYTICKKQAWDIESSAAVGPQLHWHGNSDIAIAFSPDGLWMASGSDDHIVRLWDARSGAAAGGPFLGHTDRVSCIAFSPDGRQIVSGSWDNSVRVWNVVSGKPVGGPFLGHKGHVNCVAFSPDGCHIVSGSSDSTVKVWDASCGKSIGEPFLGHTGRVNSAAFSPDGRQIVSGSMDTTVRVWDAVSGKLLGKPLLGHESVVQSVAFSSDGLRIVSGSWDQTVRLWDVLAGKPVGEPLLGHKNTVRSVAFSPDDLQIVSCSLDSTVRVWEAVSGKGTGEQSTEYDHRVTSVAFSPDGRHIVTGSGSVDSAVRLWDAKSGAAFGDPLLGHSEPITSITFSPDGSHIASGSTDHTVIIWDIESRKPVRKPLYGHDGWVTSVAFSPDGRQIVSGSRDKTVRVWDAELGIANGKPFLGHERDVQSVAFSPDGCHIASGSRDCTVRIWDIESRKPVREPLLGHKGSITSVAFSPNGLQIVSGSDDKTMRVWDAESGATVGEPLIGHTGPVTSVAFSPNGLHIISGSGDATVRVWDVASGKPVGEPLLGHKYWIYSIAVSPDGLQIVSGSGDHTARVWNLCSSTQIAASTSPTVLFSSPSSYTLLRYDGWVMDQNYKRTWFIPIQDRVWVQTAGCTAICGSRPMISFDLTNFKHGEQWAECYEM
ncbi:WD40-repeat-containing domain protein [Flagelloscypha sp. PMI_526]|nr:WD40-repeat-containing domain protein [Flagelloscypha sp. PMI_526]